MTDMPFTPPGPEAKVFVISVAACLLYTSPSPRDS